MQGASRASFGQARDSLTAVVADPAVATTLGEELFEVTGLLDREVGLRRALTDPTSPQGARSGLVRGLLGGRVSHATLDLLVDLVTARWSVPGDLPDATERLAVLATVASAREGDEIDDVEDELFRFGRIVAANPELHAALSSPLAPDDAKRSLVRTLLGDKVSAVSLRLLSQAVAGTRGRSLDATLTEYMRLAASWRERLIAEVRVATALTDTQRQRLAAALSQLYGHGVQINVVLDPHVVGGMSIQIGDEFIDGSLSNRLATLRRRLAA
ncbi:MAG TPA: F0F1 ATP synthase subunit delta [Streptosporangiaceae bacterium]|nr:F0F1 ATP synthase subunit delta [Streptosporangiaceae bacterium]